MEDCAICTLFEGDYHLGLAVLSNSLYRSGYRGTIWAGYRGSLPPWAYSTTAIRANAEHVVSDGCTIRFIHLSTEQHFANYKAEFMLEVWRRSETGTQELYYFDPDIVIMCRWAFFHEWTRFGVALCEDINSPMPTSHPIRGAWREFCESRGVTLEPRTSAYVNSGFVGLRRDQYDFLLIWQKIQEMVNDELKGGHLWSDWEGKDRTDPFFRPDQDALNMTVEASREELSLVGKEAMGFIPGGQIMTHAIGEGKPWRKSFLVQSFRGRAPTGTDRAFLRFADGPIQIYPRSVLCAKRIALKAAAALGRFMRRSGT